jgi:hypothetical protein
MMKVMLDLRLKNCRVQEESVRLQAELDTPPTTPPRDHPGAIPGNFKAHAAAPWNSALAAVGEWVGAKEEELATDAKARYLDQESIAADVHSSLDAEDLETSVTGQADQTLGPDGKPLDSVLNRSCFIFRKHACPRREIISMVESGKFETVVILAIFVNSVFLALHDPLATRAGEYSERNEVGDMAGKVFTIIFTVEMLLKWLAYGIVFGKGTYFRTSGWNYLDFLVVSTGYTDFIPDFDNQFGILRVVRLLRPLRTIGAIKGLRTQVEVLTHRETLEAVGNVCLLMAFTFTIFSIIGVNLFSGKLRGRCFADEAGGMEVTDEEAICGHVECAPEETCETTDPISGVLNENPSYDLLSFDNFGFAVLTIFVCTTLEGWTDVMYMMQDGYSDYAWIYFVVLIVTGSLIVINLFLAVISMGYEDSMAEQIEDKRFTEIAVQCINLLNQEVHHAIYRNPTDFIDHARQCSVCVKHIDVLSPEKDKRCEDCEERRADIIHSFTKGCRVALIDQELVMGSRLARPIKNLRPKQPRGELPLEEDTKAEGMADAEEGEVAEVYPRGRLLVKAAGRLEYHDAANMCLLARPRKAGEVEPNVRAGEEEPVEEARRLTPTQLADDIDARANLFFRFFDAKTGRIKLRVDAQSPKFEPVESATPQTVDLHADMPVTSVELRVSDTTAKTAQSDLGLRSPRTAAPGRPSTTYKIAFVRRSQVKAHVAYMRTVAEAEAPAAEPYPTPRRVRCVCCPAPPHPARALCLAAFAAMGANPFSGAHHRKEVGFRPPCSDTPAAQVSEGAFLTGLRVMGLRAASPGDVLQLSPPFSPRHKYYMVVVDEELDSVTLTPGCEPVVDLDCFVSGLRRLHRHNADQADKISFAAQKDSTLPENRELMVGWRVGDTADEIQADALAVTELVRMLGEKDARGKNKVWQEKMMTRVFVALDVNQDALLTQDEFKERIMHPNLAGENAMEYKVGWSDLDQDKMVGKPCMEVFTLHARFICHAGWFNNIITTVVAFNCGVLAAEYHDMPTSTADLLWLLNFTCTLVFFAEMILKLVGLGWLGYKQDTFNLFDGSIVMLSVLEIVMEAFGVQGGGISVFRALRILRIFKVTAQFDNLKRVLVTIISTIPELANFLILLCLFAFFYAVTGLHLFGGTFAELEEMPRSHFDDFGASLMSVFQILTGENWNTVMYDAMHTNGIAASAYFISLVVIGGNIMLNLFLAVLLVKTMDAFREPPNTREEIMRRAGHNPYDPKVHKDADDEFGLEGNSLFCLGPENSFRLGLQRLCRNQVFDNVLLLCIMFSSTTLAFDEPGKSELVGDILYYMDLVFTGIFVTELVLKVVTLNLLIGSKFSYLRNPWNCLDITVVAASVVSLLLKDSDIGWVKSFRVLRALRPLRVVKRVPELKQVVNSLFLAIPTIQNVLALLGMFWIIFGILGVQLFKGKFYGCSDPDTAFQEECIGAVVLENDDGVLEMVPLDWLPPPWSFDNLGAAVITLFEVSTLEMWLDIMYLCIDATAVGEAPSLYNNPAMQIFFVVFIMFGSFFMLELFVSAIVTSYSILQEASAGSSFQSERQKRVVASMVFRTPEGPFVATYDWQQSIYDFVSRPAFEHVIIACILLNMVVMAIYFEGMSLDFKDELDFYNNVFTIIFFAETVLKMLALWPARYFKAGWNCFDFLVVCVTSIELIVDTVSPGRLEEIPGLTSLRVFRIAKVFRLLAKFQGLTNLFLAVVQALPTIMNVGAILFLLFFIYAILGMNIFGYVKRGEFLTERANFESFGVALLTVFRMSTGESWNGIMADTRIVPPHCDPDKQPFSDCGTAFAPLYFVSFQLVGQFLMLNLFVAVMLEFYQRQQEGIEPYLDGHDYERFEKAWISFVGRDDRPPYLPFRLLPAELFDEFMLTLDERIGWTLAERIYPRARRKAYANLHLPTRAMKVLVPWKRGLKQTRPGYQSLAWEDKQAQERLKQAAGMMLNASDAAEPVRSVRNHALKATIASSWRDSSEPQEPEIDPSASGSMMGTLLQRAKQVLRTPVDRLNCRVRFPF